MNKMQLLKRRALSPTHIFHRFLIFFVILLATVNTSAQEKDKAYNITSPITGIISKVHVKAGQVVKKGDRLLEFDDTLMRSNLSEAKAKIKLEQLNQVEAKKELSRAEDLYDRTVLSEHELQQARLLYTRSLSQYATAKNHLVHIQWNIENSQLYATFSGQIVQVLSYPGQYVNNQYTAQTLLTIE